MIAANVLALTLAIAGASAAPLAKRSSGQATFYDAGLGACGWTNSASDFIVAINAPEWDGGSHCGQYVTITNNGNGNTQTAQVADLCPGCSYGSLDMSTGLFSALNNGNMDAGVFPISWSFGSGSSAQNNNKQQQQQQQQATTTTYAPQTTYTPTYTPASTYTPTPSPAPSAAQNNNNNDDSSSSSSTQTYAPQPASSSNSKTVVATPEWWENTGNSCNFTPDEYSIPIAISGSTLLSASDLAKACGKWIQIKNNDNGKELSVQVTNYWDGPEGAVAMAEGYKRIASWNGDQMQYINSVTWGFIDNQGM